MKTRIYSKRLAELHTRKWLFIGNHFDDRNMWSSYMRAVCGIQYDLLTQKELGNDVTTLRNNKDYMIKEGHACFG